MPTPAVRQRLLDAAAAATSFAGTVALLHGGAIVEGNGDGWLNPVGIGLAACSTAPIAAWRRHPLPVYAVTSAAAIALAGLGYRVDLLLGPTAALYLLAASREQEVTWVSALTAVAPLVLYIATIGAVQGSYDTSQLHTALAWAVAWFAGDRTRLRRQRLAELGERALRAERDAERERRLAVAEERARIARDLHDSAGHAISVIAIRAGTARLRHRQEPERTLQALAAIEELARHTVEDIDRMVGTLREQADADTPPPAPPGLASIDTLIAHHAASGLAVTAETSGTPRALGAAADQAAYRILQEALTNAARHGAGSAGVGLTYRQADLELRVSNPLPDRDPMRNGGGHGLIGMRERATLLGGDLEAGRDGATFLVRALIPYQGHQP